MNVKNRKLNQLCGNYKQENADIDRCANKDKHFIGLQIVVKFFREVNLCGRKFSSVPSELFDETVRTIFTIYWVFI